MRLTAAANAGFTAAANAGTGRRSRLGGLFLAAAAAFSSGVSADTRAAETWPELAKRLARLAQLSATCSCAAGASGSRDASPRLYAFEHTPRDCGAAVAAGNTRNGSLCAAGLNHQLSNLRAMLGEGFGLGRGVLLSPPPLAMLHNYGRPAHRGKWADLISFERSTFVTSRCNGTLASCAMELSAEDYESVTSALAQNPVGYHAGVIIDDFGPLTVRRPGHEHANLVRKLPGFSRGPGLHLSASDSVIEAAAPVLRVLTRTSGTGVVAVVHARRGDKFVGHRCPAAFRNATSPAHIAAVLMQAGVNKGSAVYVASNEPDLNFFDSLRTVYGYRHFTSAAFPHLFDLVSACNEGKGQCENYFLYSVENEIMRGVDRQFRIPTTPKPDVDHSELTLLDGLTCMPEAARAAVTTPP
ncbi:hypothetical protein M885DRAFT_538652 [Pelagophyceae sp. CCMP2097]|nr:hypothetical protein M885DRAFT_538652 [Pelagophyceae sp. CCMP2097]|mmetsp:Transcript_29775/g.100285  ORF Transcript_29775/g.100285 Transcript_29775/m.100285 type:complete len:413 (+) Transcript_29775:113-1351(+)